MEPLNQFQQAVAASKILTEQPSNEILLQLYALYKQSTTGDINIEPPTLAFDLVANAKYTAWAAQKGKSKEKAMQEYVELVEKLKGE